MPAFLQAKIDRAHNCYEVKSCALTSYRKVHGLKIDGGCLEAEASGRAIAARTGADPAAAGPDVIERTGRLVGRAVATVANLLDLQLATVAGSVALGFGSPFFEAAQKELSARARLSFSASSRIAPSRLGAMAPLIGAAAVGLTGLADA